MGKALGKEGFTVTLDILVDSYKNNFICSSTGISFSAHLIARVPNAVCWMNPKAKKPKLLEFQVITSNCHSTFSILWIWNASFCHSHARILICGSKRGNWWYNNFLFLFLGLLIHRHSMMRWQPI